MAEQGSTTSHHTTSSTSDAMAEHAIPPLKFLVSNIKNLVPTQLISDNYAIWRLQLFQHFSANGFDDHLIGTENRPPVSAITEHKFWTLIDRNLVSALFSTISPSILPYVISLSTTHEVWTTLERRLQPTNRSRVIQLKNELHHIQMRDQTMRQYLNQIKILVDNIAAAGSVVDTEDIVLYILNGLSPTYNAFKTAIRTSLQPISLDDLYSLLCNEEINLQHQQLKENPNSEVLAMLSNRNYSGQGRSGKQCVKNYPPRNQQSVEPSTSGKNSSNRPSCQIWGKTGHSALNCWHRCNLNYAPPSNPKALTVQQQYSSTTDWILDSGASSHLTADASNIQQLTPYQGSDSVSIANGQTLPIHNSGQGILLLNGSSSRHPYQTSPAEAISNSPKQIDRMLTTRSI
ncbi:Retrovirus-related Pol polyprotein from transposon TNT 1-94 [Dendrobium catenatum]|uniref:Retrovirus-related Pol polyprotein from transposon TNT 1-94 n=1 Tax=Dendrobium catenatum TaxID=906689 RepID=A0A2I0WJ99_9ASPA|nr:Retrovirus-related Pol polyprotein from transposon TNT 1-94 [Dendrobium catenatum]